MEDEEEGKKEDMTPTQLYDKIKADIVKLETCVGDNCKAIQTEFDKKLAKAKVALTPDQLAGLKQELDKGLTDDFKTNVQGLHTRMSQYDKGMKDQTKAVEAATEEVKTITEKLTELSDAMAKREKAAEALGTKAAEAKAEAKVEDAEPPKPVAPDWVKKLEDDGCPNCGYDHLTPPEPLKYAAFCPECTTKDEKGRATGFTTYEIEAQGYKFCPECGGGLTALTNEERKKIEEAAKKKVKTGAKVK